MVVSKICRFIRFGLLQLYGFWVFRRRVWVHGYFTVGNSENIRIGAHCAINSGVHILGHTQVTLGSHVVLSVGVKILDAGLDLTHFAQVDEPVHQGQAVCIEDGAWVGAGAIVLPGVTIGRKSVVGAGSVVTRNVPPCSIVAGNPARVMGRTDV